jgi:hypothetical protein
MKISKQAYEELRSQIAKLDRDRIAAGLPGYAATAAEYRERGHSPLRFRAEWLRAAAGSRWVCDVLYMEGLNDDHIDSALRQVARDLTADKDHWTARKA